MAELHRSWGKILTPDGVQYMVKYKFEILCLYYRIGVYWNKELSLKVGDTFTISNSKFKTYKAMNTAIAKSDERIGNIIVSSEYAAGLLFKYKGHLMWIRHSDGEVIQVSSLFNWIGMEQIQQRIDSFEYICKNDKLFTWKDKKQFFCIPKNKIGWD